MNTLCGGLGVEGTYSTAQIHLICTICRETALYLVPQVFGWAAYVSIEMRHVDKLRNASLSGCLCNLLRDGHKHVLKAIIPCTEKQEETLASECSLTPSPISILFLSHPKFKI